MDEKTKRSRRLKSLIAVVTLLVVFVGLYSQLFVSLGIFNFNHQKPVVELDALEVLGVDSNTLEKDITRMVANMSNAQQGNHFVFGVIAGLVFSQPAAGVTVGLIKEALDFFNNYADGLINGSYFIDSFVDIVFWALGGFVGFYLLVPLYDIFRENKIKNPKDLVMFLSKKIFRRRTNS